MFAEKTNIQEDLSTNCLHFLIVDDEFFNVMAIKLLLWNIDKTK